MKLTEKRALATIREHGYKVTPQRRAVLKVIARSRNHLTPAAIYQKVHQEHPGTGLVTVYRTLEILAHLGLICKLHAEDNCRSYSMRRPAEHHHHLLCSDCGRVVDFSGCYLGELEQKLAQETGFEIETHLLEFLGRCQDCQKGAPA